ncbi:MAG TPA: prolyl oligopeptidase family serine peptidase [Pyrinomonadaceae bacterium]|nr:prolyl oligopeptidase family serine peptidase [Pyrinomonadaceae bacterium]
MIAPAMRGLVLLLVSVISLSAQSSLQPLPVETASTSKSFAAVEFDLSPDGAWVAYVLTDPRRRKLQGLPSDEWKAFTCTSTPYLLANTDLLISNTKTGQTINISSGKGANWEPSWSPDGKSLAFYSDRSGKAHVWIWERSTGKLRTLTTAVVHARSRLEKIFWTPDGRQVLTKITGNTQTFDCFDGTTKREPFNPAERSVYESESPPLKLPPSADSFLGDLAMLDTRSGSVQRIIKQEKIVAYSLSPSGDRVVYASPTQLKPDNRLLFTYNLSVVSLSNGQTERVKGFSPGAPSLPASWSPDGQTIAYISDGECFIWSRGEQPRKVSASARVRFMQTPLWDKEGRAIYVLADNKIWRIPTTEAKATAITATWNRQIRSIVSRHDGQQIWSPDGASIYVNISNSVTKQEGFYRVDSRTGEFSKALEADISINPMLRGVSHDDELMVYAAENARQELNLWITNRDFTNVRQLTHVNPDLERYPAGDARLIDYSTADGKKLQATLLLPVNYQSDRRYPLVVWVYGGSMLSANVNRYGGSGNEHYNLQLFSSRGYAVLLPDTPLTVGTPMSDLAKTVLPAIDKTIELGIADPDRLGVMGASYGGYSTLALVIQTQRFKAAVMDVGFGNLSSMYGEMLKSGASNGVSWAEEGQGRMGGPPWQFPERYVQNSPAFFLNKIETPLLISQGGMDVSPYQADEIFVGLRRLGKKVVYVRYENEGHGIEYPSNRIDYWNRILEWFASHLRPAAPQQPSFVRN